MLITASAINPPEQGTSWDERQEGADKGLISAWLAGRAQRAAWSEIALAATRGELPPLPFKGGVEREIRATKTGALHYVAMWQGLRGEDLHIDLSSEIEKVCARTGVTVVFTADISKLLQATAP